MTNFQYFMECSGDNEADAMQREWEEQQRQREYAAQAEYEQQLMEAYDEQCRQESECADAT